MSFRNIDVDTLDEDILVQNELFDFSNGVDIDPETALNNVQTKVIEVRNRLTRYGFWEVGKLKSFILKE